MRFFYAISLVALLPLSMLSCSVFEDRVSCPCDVTVTCDGNIHSGHRGDVSVSIFVDEMMPRTLSRTPHSLDDFISGACTYQVPKGWFRVCVVGGLLGNMKMAGDTLLLIPEGTQCDSVCAFTRACYTSADDDSYVVRGPLDKQFCTLTIRLEQENGAAIPAETLVRGSYDGFSLKTLQPHPGAFRCRPDRITDGVYSVRVPRQNDASLEMDIYGGPASELETVELGALLAASGYSWGTLSLDDASVLIRYGRTGFTVSIDGWESGEISFVVENGATKANERDAGSVMHDGMRVLAAKPCDESVVFCKTVSFASGKASSGEYWPQDSELDFFAVSPPGEELSYEYGGCDVSIGNAKSAFDGDTDIVVAKSLSCSEQGGEVALRFFHPLSCLASLRCRYESSSSSSHAVIRSISVRSPSYGTLTLSGSSSRTGNLWSSLGTSADHLLFSGSAMVDSSWNGIWDEGFFLLPSSISNGEVYTLKVCYDIVSGTGDKISYDKRETRVKLPAGKKAGISLTILGNDAEMSVYVIVKEWNETVDLNENF